MALFPAGFGLPIGPMGGLLYYSPPASTSVDAAGESCAAIGRIKLSSGPGTTKTFSAAGGARIGVVQQTTITWANGASNLRVGIQGVNATTGVEDGTWSTYGDLTGGTGGLAIETLSDIPMTSGSVSISHDDLISVVFELTARGGADALRPQRNGPPTTFPYSTLDTGSGPVKSSAGVFCFELLFDDGTIGYLTEFTLPIVFKNQSYNDSSTPDEYGFAFKLPFTCTTNALFGMIGELDPSEPGELILYSNPFGTPVVEASVSLDSVYSGFIASDAGFYTLPITEFQLLANTPYAVSYRPTNTANRTIQLRTIKSTWKQFNFFGDNFWGVTRTDNTGAFASSDTIIPVLGCILNNLQDDGPTNSAIATAVWAYTNRTLS